MRVSNLTSPRSGNPVANQYLIEGLPAGTFHDKEGNRIRSGEAFQSYFSMIAFRDHQGTIYLDATYWDYSNTTLKYLREFLGNGDMTKDIRRKIGSGEYKLANLN